MTVPSDPEPSQSAGKPVELTVDRAALLAHSTEHRSTIVLAWLNARRSSLFVWGVYFLCLGWVSRFVYLNVVNVPFGDDWDLLSWTTGERPVDWSWLWSQHNEHRILLSKLILLAVYGFSGHDFRAGCWVVLIMQALLTAVLIGTANRVRGRSTWTDIVFPLALFNAGHCENLTWSFQVQFGGSAFVSGILLALIVRRPSGPQKWWEISAMALFSLALCGFGASGIVYVPFLVVWQLYLAWRNWQIGGAEGPPRAIAILLSAILTAAVLACYLTGLQRMPYHPLPPTVGSILDIVLKFWSLGIVANARPYWPTIGWIVPPILIIVGLRLLKVFWCQPAERIRSLGLVAFLGAFISLAVGIGWGRAGLGGHMGFSHRYVTLSVASVLLTYWVVLLYSPPRYRYLLQILLCAGLVCSFAMNRQAGKEWSILRIALLRSFDKDLQGGMRAALLADAYGTEQAGTPIYPSPELLSRYVLLLREKQLGHFRKAPRDGDSRVEILDLSQAIPENATWDAATRSASILQPDGGVTIKLTSAVYVQRINLELQAGSGPSGSIPGRITVVLPSGKSRIIHDHPIPAADTPLNLWLPVEQEISGLRITLGQAPAQVRVRRVTLLCGLPGKD